MTVSNVVRIGILLLTCGLMTACATSGSQPETENQMAAAELNTDPTVDSEITEGLSELIENDPEIEQLPGDPSLEELEEDFASVNKEQLREDIQDLNSKISSTKEELTLAKALLEKMISENRAAQDIAAQKSRVVVLEDQLFELGDEKSMKEIEASDE